MASLFNNVHFSMSDKIEQQHTQLKIDQDLLVNGNISGNTISCNSLNSSGNITSGTNALTCGTLSCGSLTSSGAITTNGITSTSLLNSFVSSADPSVVIGTTATTIGSSNLLFTNGGSINTNKYTVGVSAARDATF